MFSASIVDAGKRFEVVDARSLVPVVVAIPEPGGGHTGIDRYRQAKQATARTVLEAKTRVWEEFGEAMEEDYREEAEAGDSEVDSSITQAEVTEVVRKLLGGKAPGVDEIRPDYLKSLDVVGLSWLTRLCNIAWRLGTVPLEWQTGVVVPLFKNGDRRVCSNYRGITLLSLPGKVYARVLRGGVPLADSRPSGFRRNNAVFVPVVEHWTSSIPSAGCLRVYGSLPNQSTCALWIWRRHSTVSLMVFCGECSSEYGVRGPLGLRATVRSLYRPEQELGSHCRQISRRSIARGQGPEGVRFGNHRISSLLFADDVVLLASSSQDLQHVLERFAAECEAAGMRISTSKSEAMEKGGVPSPGGVERSCLKWRSSSISGSCSRVRERWSVRLTGGLVQRAQLCGRCTGPSW
ncbi:hypothetical protein L3Q82_002295 [Scortum barcoo]|uniref:Uncharacterized protein n=1 Tax=Scortum barcoo TaxID=214431 RepID=A0ACB8VXF7_9TELE|nr:hypothetical protein L3Q82_002295 [Scortum barcoo]